MSTHTFRSSNLSGRVVAITGAGSGIGQALALLCARRGADLALCDINLTNAEAVAEECRALGVRATATKVDVSIAEEMESFARATEAEFGIVDLLVNNAGVAVIGGFLDTNEKDWDWLVSINLMGVVHGCNAFVPAMRARGAGHVVNLSSAAGLLANPQLTAYSATKYAVRGLSEGLRMELGGDGIGVTAVCPGVINTPITANSPFRGGNEEARRKNMMGMYAKRGYTADQVAEKVLAAVERNKAIAPVAAEAHLLYALNRFTPGLARWVSTKLAAIAS